VVKVASESRSKENWMGSFLGSTVTTFEKQSFSWYDYDYSAIRTSGPPDSPALRHCSGPSYLPITTGQEGKSLGQLPTCGHALKGEVFVKNEREVIIKGFHYDGSGPAAWFHAMKKGAMGGIYTAGDWYYTLPFPGGSCDRVKGEVYTGNKDITLILPVSIKELETIGMLCYQYCHNFGHVSIPHDLDVPAAPADLPETKVCPKPDYDACHSKGGAKPTRDGGPNCGEVGTGPPGSSGTPGSTGNKMEARLRLENLLPALLFLAIDIGLRVNGW
ncbi:Protein Skeletor, isoforms D/E, partial [Orchesella cincta]